MMDIVDDKLNDGSPAGDPAETKDSPGIVVYVLSILQPYKLSGVM